MTEYQEFSITNPDRVFTDSGWSIEYRTKTPDGEIIRHNGPLFYNGIYDLFFSATPKRGWRKIPFEAVNPYLAWWGPEDPMVSVIFNDTTDAGLSRHVWRSFDYRRWDFTLRFIPKKDPVPFA